MQDAASGPNALRVARPEMIGIAQAVAMIDATFEQVAQHFDPRMRMGSVADAASAVMPIVIDEDEGPERCARGQRQGAPEQHVSVVDDALGGQHGIDGSLHGVAMPDALESPVNSLTDFVTDDFDVSIRLGRVADSRLIARPLHGAQFCVVASPAYLDRQGTPHRPDDLLTHRCIDLVLPDTGRPIPWQFLEEGECRDAKLSSRLEVDHPLAALTAALNGGGLARLLDFTVESELRAGDLVEVLADFRPPGQVVSVVYPSNRHQSAKIRSFLNFLVEALGEASYCR